VPTEPPEHRHAREAVTKFTHWRDERYGELACQHRQFGLKAELAKRILAIYPDCEPAWDALARFYHNEARLGGALDSLIGERASRWDTVPLTELFDAWELAHAS
jgi:hypothetical protein